MPACGGGSTTPRRGQLPRQVPGTILVPAGTAAHDRSMRYESCVTSLSWIPSEAITGAEPGLRSTEGFTHYDDPPPAEFGDIEELRAADRFRFANVLRAWIEVDDAGQITAGGYDGGGLMGIHQGPAWRAEPTFQAVAPARHPAFPRAG